MRTKKKHIILEIDLNYICDTIEVASLWSLKVSLSLDKSRPIAIFSVLALSFNRSAEWNTQNKRVLKLLMKQNYALDYEIR